MQGRQAAPSLRLSLPSCLPPPPAPAAPTPALPRSRHFANSLPAPGGHSFALSQPRRIRGAADHRYARCWRCGDAGGGHRRRWEPRRSRASPVLSSALRGGTVPAAQPWPPLRRLRRRPASRAPEARSATGQGPWPAPPNPQARRPSTCGS